ncbi:YnjH family protein [Aeromonas sp. HMWF014]|jgi:hypothetical protein|uniref:YnjH family protein n=1 Tax=Aeromonas sp. HMWF014 TaxID=2056850 RepID=UPI000D3848FF|nr:YnjH family protein [Aeromonas sp. HMWF014]PTT55082.1 DUF1496 domain-containing protein [Aeromonas sp. HMWF014]
MRKILLCLLASCWCVPALAATHTTIAGERASPKLVLPLGSLPERVCWYQDQKYSLGARIKQGDSWRECSPQNAQESNGPLAWREPERASNVADNAARSSTITVGQ